MTLNRNRKNYNLRDGSLHTEEKTVLDMTTFFFLTFILIIVFEHPIV